MCGLVALFQPVGTPDERLLGRMAESIAHRGPDDQGRYVADGVAFAHRRLSIIDVAGGHQPMAHDGVALVFNGEIYNFSELRDELIGLGHVFRTRSDTEVLLRMYLAFGTDCFARLDGMFALVLHDARRGIAVAARDHFGIKPLYWWSAPGRLAYASEIKALLRDPSVARRVDPEALEDYLSLQFVLGERTLFEGIRRVEPAHYQVIDLATLAVRNVRYWTPDYRVDPAAAPGPSLEQVRELLAASVARQMRSDVPVGAYLSGGMDSSLVSALAARSAPAPMPTFTGSFREGPQFDESAHALTMARHIGADPQVVWITEADWIDSLPKLAWQMDEPAAGPGLVPQYIVSRAARARVKVCLGGQGGDEIFGGYARHLIGALEQALLAAMQGRAGAPGDLALADLEHGLGTLQGYLPMLRRAWADGLDAPAHQRYFRLIDRRDAAGPTLGPVLRERMARSQVAERFEQLFERPSDCSPLKRMLHADLVSSLPALLQVEDRVSMAVSLESRVPLLSAPLVDAVARLPDAMLLSGGRLKAAMRDAAAPLLPASILNRRDKMGFPVPLQHWARGPARDFVCDLLLSQRARQRGLFDPAAITRLIDDEAQFGRALWGALQLELWHQTMIDPATL
ncbi:MAG TPA: asparagine synthase (glutamine-hydrolyzing) [Burkholderiaceae bacterium]|nr:asparagine synthase (glutamine-hydrolyzing) [Burkholderiaceae bacterium]